MREKVASSSGINIARIPVTGGAGGIFAAGTISILLIGLPEVRYLLPASLLLGAGIAAVLRFLRRDAPRV